MPGRDGTGPNGTYENCKPTSDAPYFGRGRGFGRGRMGRASGFDGDMYNPRGLLRPRYQTNPSTESGSIEKELSSLKEQERTLKEKIESIEKKLGDAK